MTKVKICGLKTLADVEKVNRYLPEYIGFVFADTRRFVTDDQAFNMRQALDQQIQAVGVFVNEPMEHIIRLCDMGVINLVQLHGEESEDYIRKLKQKTDTPVIKAVKVQSAGQLSGQVSQEADFILFDTYKKGSPGGTGERFPLEILEDGLKKMRDDGQIIKPYFMAGGLDCQNVAEVLCRVDCFAVDVSSGVETDGVKDENKIRQFIELVRTIGKGDL